MKKCEMCGEKDDTVDYREGYKENLCWRCYHHLNLVEVKAKSYRMS